MSNLQILRFLAALMVLVSHVQHEALKGVSLDISNYHPWTAIFFNGGVDIFFVISGFIMCTIASGDFGQPGAVSKFLIRRMLRIVPPYWFFTTAMIGATIIFQSHVTHPALSAPGIVASYFFFPFRDIYGRFFPVLPVGWTLNYEFFFYLVFGSALFFRKKIGLPLIFCVIGVLGTIGAIIKPDGLPLSFWSSPIIFEFLYGIALAMLRERDFRLPAFGGCFCIVAGFAAMWVLKSLHIPEDFYGARALWMGLPALLICAGFVLVEESPSAHWGGFKPLLILLGDASYAIYLSHMFALNLVALLWRHVGSNSPWLYFWVALPVSIGFGVLVHLVLEKPITQYLNRRFGGSSSQKSTSIAVISKGGTESQLVANENLDAQVISIK